MLSTLPVALVDAALNVMVAGFPTGAVGLHVCDTLGCHRAAALTHVLTVNETLIMCRPTVIVPLN